MFKQNDTFEKFPSKVWLSSPTMYPDSMKYVMEAYETNWMSTVGANINEVEHQTCEKVGCKYAVALFLALSGYGVMNSLKNKKNYLNGFLKSRIAKVYVPFILSNCIFLCIKYLNNENFDMLQIIKYILGIELIDSSMWFIIMIMVCYVIFYLIFK